MTTDDRIARLTELARKAFGDRFDGRIMPLADGGVDVVTKAGGLLFAIANHDRAMAALEAALLVLAEEKSLITLLLERIAQRLESHATELRATGTEIGSKLDEVYRELAAELRAAAKEVP